MSSPIHSYYSGGMLVEEPLSGRASATREEPAAERLDLPTVLAALADPGRLAIVHALAAQGEECCNRVGELAGLTVGKSTLSHHMKVLRESGVTHTRAQGTHRYVSLRREELDEAFPQLMDAILGASAGVGGGRRQISDAR
ncbi:MAG TPA: metalloregulator ArsR/SmtB family transcription factor [Actinocrinis sp.]|nr:metalloregulator ArsR/SmtB family transcription factor [Actinocrinis sp.]